MKPLTTEGLLFNHVSIVLFHMLCGGAGGIKSVRILLLLTVYTFTDEVWRRHRNRIMTKSLQQTGYFFISARLLFLNKKVQMSA